MPERTKISQKNSYWWFWGRYIVVSQSKILIRSVCHRQLCALSFIVLVRSDLLLWIHPLSDVTKRPTFACISTYKSNGHGNNNSSTNRNSNNSRNAQQHSSTAIGSWWFSGWRNGGTECKNKVFRIDITGCQVEQSDFLIVRQVNHNGAMGDIQLIKRIDTHRFQINFISIDVKIRNGN